MRGKNSNIHCKGKGITKRYPLSTSSGLVAFGNVKVVVMARLLRKLPDTVQVNNVV
jgi:hypothetical protein